MTATRLAHRLPLGIVATLTVMAVGCGSERGDGGAANFAAQRQTFHMDSLHPMLQPTTREHRPYIGQHGDPELTVVIAVRLDGTDRFLLAQEPQDGGQLIVVDSNSRIPAFATLEEARSYRARAFPPVIDSTDTLATLVRRQMQSMVDSAPPIRVDLDAVLAWARDPGSRRIGPSQAGLAWDLLTGAGVAPARLPFDPMGMYGLSEDLRGGTIDSASFRIAMTGMVISGFQSESRRRGADPDTRDPFPGDTSVWNDERQATLSEVLARGIIALRTRLSTDFKRP